MDDSRNLDLDRLMEQIRLNLHERRQATGAAPAAASANEAEDERRAMEGDFRTLHGSYDIAGVDLNPNRRVFGWTLLRAARFISGVLKPMIRQQSEYNAANTRVTDRLSRQVEALAPQYAATRTLTERALERNLEELKAQSDAALNRYVKLHADDIAMHANALSTLTQRLGTLERRQADLERQSARADLLESVHGELQSLGRRHAELRDELDRLGIASHGQTLHDLTARVETLAGHYADATEQTQRLITERFSEQAQQVKTADTRFAQLVERIDLAGQAQTRAESLARQHDEKIRLMRERIWRVERRLRRMLNGEAGTAAAIKEASEVDAAPEPIEIDYAGFEERIRGDTQIKVKQGRYVDFFAGKAPVVDIGCGGGEFLELMREAGVEALGLDRDLDMVLLCKEKGLNVAHCDAIDHLARQPDASIGGIFSAQVIEHMTPTQLSTLVALSYRKLRHGGVVVFETLNPESLFVHYKWFWMDPSHVRLVHPQTLTFLLESAGFVEVSSRFISPPDGVLRIPPLRSNGNGAMDEFNRATDYLNKLIFGDQEYFIVGRK